MLAHSNEDLAYDQQEGTITDFKPLTQAIDLPIRFLNPKMGQAYNNQANGENVPQTGGNLYDSDFKHPSWEPKVDFSVFSFNKQTKTKQVSIRGYLTCKSDILHIYSILVPRASLGPEHEVQKALGTQD